MIMLSLTDLRHLPTQKQLWLGPVGCWRTSTQHDLSKEDPGLGRLNLTFPNETPQQPTLELAAVMGKESASIPDDVPK